ncbi:MAG: hypothetical protein Barrevirus29_3 [Barrevirus sp.]|uniref:Uncharacterized protein n=1 Tax=Barrevirus sp. TaxID=2487763 RepID=A0A3G4ZQV6_9VIRU|nr:MAG: hypothetical protein Barrevirus29_3 [Barrevirus sp.]
MSNPEIRDNLNESITSSYLYRQIDGYRDYLIRFPQNMSQYINWNLWITIRRSIKNLNKKDITKDTLKLILAKQRIRIESDEVIDKILNKIQNPDSETLISQPVMLKDGSKLNKTIGDLLIEFYGQVTAFIYKEFPDRQCVTSVYLTGKIVDLILLKYELANETIVNLINLKTMAELDNSIKSKGKILNMDKHFNHILPLLTF